MGDLSDHFSRKEFACHHCGEVRVDPRLIDALERVRELAGDRPLRIVSGFRCGPHNRAVGGARGSQHLFGRAADLAPGAVSRQQALSAGFTGIGTCEGWAVHVDVRPGQRVVFDDCPGTP